MLNAEWRLRRAVVGGGSRKAPLLPFVVTLGALSFLFGLARAQAALPDPRFGAVEAFRAPADAAELGLGWERAIFFWNQLQPSGPDEWNEF